jgi:hypothetical protein
MTPMPVMTPRNVKVVLATERPRKIASVSPLPTDDFIPRVPPLRIKDEAVQKGEAFSVNMLAAMQQPVPGKPYSIRIWILGDGSTRGVSIVVRDPRGRRFMSKASPIVSGEWICPEWLLHQPHLAVLGGDATSKVAHPVRLDEVRFSRSEGEPSTGAILLSSPTFYQYPYLIDDQ